MQGFFEELTAEETLRHYPFLRCHLPTGRQLLYRQTAPCNHADHMYWGHYTPQNMHHSQRRLLFFHSNGTLLFVAVAERDADLQIDKRDPHAVPTVREVIRLLTEPVAIIVSIWKEAIEHHTNITIIRWGNSD